MYGCMYGRIFEFIYIIFFFPKRNPLEKKKGQFFFRSFYPTLHYIPTFLSKTYLNRVITVIKGGVIGFFKNSECMVV